MIEVLSLFSTIFDVIQLTVSYWRCFLSFAFFKNDYSQCTYFENDTHAKVQVFSLSLIFKLWSEPHYRSRDFQEDMLNNLKNVAVPGTGLALSWFCYSKWTAYWFILFANPIICFIGAIHQTNKAMLKSRAPETDPSVPSSSQVSGVKSAPSSPSRGGSSNPPPLSPGAPSMTTSSNENVASFIESISDSFIQLFRNLQYAQFYSLLYDQYNHNLLHPDDWFSLWRMNCRLVSYHSFITKSEDYKMEDKWTFLTQGKVMNVPISPYFDNMESIVCKNKLIEGGMGIHFYRNAAFGGEWIIQEKLLNAPWLNELLPHNAPLSTMRVITTSTYSVSEEFPKKKEQNVKKVVSSSGINNLDILFEKVDTTTSNASPIASSPDKVDSSLTSSLTSKSSDEYQNQESKLGVDVSDKDDLLCQARKYINAESGVLRLGRMNANTDHSSILFDVNLQTGEIKPGTTNAHWYQLGAEKVLTTPWLPPRSDIRQHIDYPYPVVAGKFVPDIQHAVDIVVR